MRLQGAKWIGGNPNEPRAENDFYATNPVALKMLMEKYEFKGKDYLEPSVGQGHLANVLIEQGFNVEGIDVVDRGWKNVQVADFLTWQSEKKYDGIVTNPPYSLAQEFIEKGMTVLKDGGQMAMFLKIQFLEGQKRQVLFDTNPPKYIYVFRNRMSTWRDGNEIDPKTGKRWATTLCHAWFIWEKCSHTEPILRWL